MPTSAPPFLSLPCPLLDQTYSTVLAQYNIIRKSTKPANSDAGI